MNIFKLQHVKVRGKDLRQIKGEGEKKPPGKKCGAESSFAPRITPKNQLKT
jgi:hypothetical protein